MTLFGLCDCFSFPLWRVKKVSKVFLDVGVETLKTKTKIILGSFRTNVFLVSHIKVGGKYNFFLGRGCRPGLHGHGGRTVVTGLGFRRWFQGSGSLHGLTHLNRSSHAGKVSVAARGHGSPQIRQITCKHIRPEGNVCHAKSPAPSPWPDPLPFLCLVEQEVGPQSGGTRPQRPGPEQGGIWGEESSSVGVRGWEQEQWLQQEPASVS